MNLLDFTDSLSSNSEIIVQTLEYLEKIGKLNLIALSINSESKILDDA